jgi:hypothetical protein
MSDDDMSMIPYNGGSNMDVVLYVFSLPSTALEPALIITGGTTTPWWCLTVIRNSWS